MQDHKLRELDFITKYVTHHSRISILDKGSQIIRNLLITNFFKMRIKLTGMKEQMAERIILETIKEINEDPYVVKGNGCAACHVLFTLSKEMKLNEQDASNLLSEILLSNPVLDSSFIEMIEYIHMKRRMMGTVFALKTREVKDSYILSNLKNTLEELQSDMICYGVDIVLRKLLLTMISLDIAKNIGIDHHASTEELYYVVRKHESRFHENITEFIDQLRHRIQNKH